MERGSDSVISMRRQTACANDCGNGAFSFADFKYSSNSESFIFIFVLRPILGTEYLYSFYLQQVPTGQGSPLAQQEEQSWQLSVAFGVEGAAPLAMATEASDAAVNNAALTFRIFVFISLFVIGLYGT